MPITATGSTICAARATAGLWRCQYVRKLNERFGYVFKPLRSPEEGQPVRYYKPVLVPHKITGDFDIAGVHIKPFEQDHRYSKTLGFCIGDFAYSTDVVKLDGAAYEMLEGAALGSLIASTASRIRRTRIST